jgi:DNA-directed RNA polymerase subunit RPC12/RpoP
MEEEIDCEYEWADCGQKMTLQVTEKEMRSSLRSGRTEQCPKCGQSVGSGTVDCRRCGAKLTVEMLHWHVHCDVFSVTCPNCGSSYISGCMC